MPTSTYLAYADEYLPPHLYEWIGTDRGHVFARDNELRSLYDYHSDGSGVSLVSTRKPKATLRDDYRYPLCGDPHNLPVDLHFLKFCARNDIAVDVLTDARPACRSGRPCSPATVPSRPAATPNTCRSRWSRPTATTCRQAGNLAYLGGNGFAAAVAYRDDLMELRRGPTQAGRTWDGPLAEMGLALTNEPGGYLRDRGRGEYGLVGVGISLMGFSPALPYDRTARPAATVRWLFDGVSDSFGDSGIVLGAAAGYEVDAVNYHLGSPEDITVVATATGFADSYVDDPGKMVRGRRGGTPGPPARRYDAYGAIAGGGSVFSAPARCPFSALCPGKARPTTSAD